MGGSSGTRGKLRTPPVEGQGLSPLTLAARSRNFPYRGRRQTDAQSPLPLLGASWQMDHLFQRATLHHTVSEVVTVPVNFGVCS